MSFLLSDLGVDMMPARLIHTSSRILTDPLVARLYLRGLSFLLALLPFVRICVVGAVMRVGNRSRTVAVANPCVSLRAFGHDGYNKLKVLNGFGMEREGGVGRGNWALFYFFLLLNLMN